jgi:hypothetical protein
MSLQTNEQLTKDTYRTPSEENFETHKTERNKAKTIVSKTQRILGQIHKQKRN